MKGKLSFMWRATLALVLVLSLGLVMAAPVSATPDVTITKATGGEAISADTAGGTPWTTLTGPIIAEGVAADIGMGTIILKAPSGFEFNNGQVVTATVTGDATKLVLASNTVSPSSGEGGTITFTVNSVSVTNPSTITFSDIQVRPTSGTSPLASGDILTTGSTSVIVGVTHGTTSFGTLTEVPGALHHFTVVPATYSPVVAETVTLTVTAKDQFDNTLTTYSESLFLSQTGASTPALIAWSGADVTDYGDGTGRFTGTWTNSICTVDVSYTIASEAVILKVTGDSTSKLGSSAAVTWVAVEIATIVGTTYQNGNDTILITFGTEVLPTSEGPWSAAVFASVKCDTVELSLVGAIFTPASGLTDTLTITLDEAVAYLVNGKTVSVTPALEAIKGTGGNFVPNTVEVSAAPVSGDSVAPTVALTYNPDREVKDADTLTITATFSEAMPDTPQIAIATQGDGDLSATDMSMGADRTVWTYAWNVASGTDEDGTATVTITGDDLAGNAVGTHSNATFDIDNTVPTIAVSAVVGLTSGDADTITITFSEDVDATDGDFTNGNEVAGITLKKTAEADVTVDLTGATFAYVANDLTITLAETGNVQDYLLNTYTVTFDPSDTNTIEDGALNLLAVTAIVGTTPVTGDSSDPAMDKVVGMIKTGDDTVTITFSEAVVAADGTWSADEFTIESPADAPLNIDHASFALDVTNTILTITLNETTDGAFLVVGSDVKVTPVALAVLDLAGNSLPTTPVTSAVVIADPAYPYITSIVGTTILDAGDTIIITFSEAVEPADEVTPGWSKDEFSSIESPDGASLTLTNATFDATDTVLTITLDEATDGEYLVNGDKVFVTPVASAIEDAAGNPVPVDEVESAAVVSGDTVAPTIVSIAGTIVPGATETWERDIIRIDFSEAVVPVGNWAKDAQFTTINADLTGATFAPASGITRTLTITLDNTKPLVAGETLTVTPEENKVVDLAGNAMSTDAIPSAAPVQAPSAAFVIDLEADWNLISLPLVPTDADIEAVLAGLVNANTVLQVRAYNASDESWSRWASTGPFAENPTLTEMNDGLGFWIKMSTVDKLVASGSELPAPPETMRSYRVYEGWNLIGFKSLPDSTVLAYLGTLVDATREAMYGYDASGVIYIPIIAGGDPLYPGQGYWLAVNTDGTIYP